MDDKPDYEPLPGGRAVGPKGEVANERLVAHSEKFRARVWPITERVHCLVGRGLANTTLVVGDDGIVVVDTGESVEEAREHVEELRTVTGRPLVGVVYSHFHYVQGTRAWLDDADRHAEADPDRVEIWAHERLPHNVAHMAAETGPSWARRAMIQFGFFLPADGPDAMPNLGIGPYMFNPAHTSRTAGHVEPTHLVRDVDGTTTATLAGVRFELTPARSDSDDTLVIHLPDEGVVINNHLWPALFNIYPLRGEPYRDPLVLLEGLELMRDLEPEHLVGVHGPPISGRAEVQQALRDYGDAIQFLWDQTVRGINANLAADDLAHRIELPTRLAASPYVQQFYGLVPHHVRQIHNGIVGWFGNDCADLLPLSPSEEARRIVDGFGGRPSVLAELGRALDGGDPSWAARLSSWLLRVDPDDQEARVGQAAALRDIARSTTSANVRAFCLTRARELEGLVDLTPFTRPMVTEENVHRAPPDVFVRALRVQLEPARCADADRRLVLDIDEADGPMALHVRGGVAAFEEPPRGPADLRLHLPLAAWAAAYCGLVSLGELTGTGRATLETGSLAELEELIGWFPDSLLG